MTVNAFAEVVSIGAVLPFIGALTAPERVLSSPQLAGPIRYLGITTGTELMWPVTMAFAASALIAATVRILLLWSSTRLAFACGADISINMYRRTLYQPYRVHVVRNSSEVINGLTNKSSIAAQTLYQTASLVSALILLVIITIALYVLNAMAASVAIIGFGGAYAVITLAFRKQLKTNSARIANESTQVVKALQEGLGAIRDVILDGNQPLYCEIYRRADHPLRRAIGNNTFISVAPRYVIEALGMVLFAGLAYLVASQPGGAAMGLPILGALALGAQRLLPALQQSYVAWTAIAGNVASLNDVLALLDQPMPADNGTTNVAQMVFNDAIVADNVSFRYGLDGPWILDHVSFTIRKGDRVGFVGTTGSGKSTMLDVIMGLIRPDSGEVRVDGEVTMQGDARVQPWQRTIAHVPQSIYLADGSFAENIAFGVPREEINMERVRQAARQARIADFIDSRNNGYQALVGERGIALSGGQRQRVGIARALYKQAKVLILDEATSALDSATEQEVMNCMEELSRDLTILMVAHRLTTVRRCDRLVEIQQGRVVAQGTYAELYHCSQSFRAMVDSAEGER